MKMGCYEDTDGVFHAQLTCQASGTFLFERINSVPAGNGKQTDDIGDFLFDQQGVARVQILHELPEHLSAGFFDVYRSTWIVLKHGSQNGTGGSHNLSVGCQDLAVNIELQIG